MKDVSLFIPCIVDQWLPEIGDSTVELLRHTGCRPYFRREQTCCGQVLYNSGQTRPAKKLARRFLKIFGNDETIVCPSASCVHMVRRNYPLLFKDEPEMYKKAVEVSGRVWELCEFLVYHMKVTDLGAGFDGTVTFHESCSHLHGLGLGGLPGRLLAGVEGLDTVAMEGSDICCGFGGRFSVEYPEISTAMVADRAAGFIDSGADVLVLCEPGCLLNLSGYVSRHYPGKRVVHMAGFLAENL
ncbi:MAG: (Fe-S)-binding protein [Desulfosalsimonas sp.]